jgi:hypothetical protein
MIHLVSSFQEVVMFLYGIILGIVLTPFIMLSKRK